MLFRRNERSFKFHLLGLGSIEYAEISKLITKNGGEICDERDPPVITLTDDNGYTGGEPVFHIKYIHNCIRRGELLDLIHFKFGAPGFYGCLMSLLIFGTNSCPSINHLNRRPRCSSTQIEPSKEQSSPIITEHNYAQGDAAVLRRGEPACSYIQGIAVNASQQGDERTSQDSQYLPVESTPSEDSNFSRNRSLSPEVSSSLPAESILTKNFHFLSDRSLSLRDSEFLPVESSSPQDLDFVINENESNVTTINEEISNLEIRENNIAVGIPEPISFEELSYVENSFTSEETVQEFPNLCTVSDNFRRILLRPETVNERIIIPHSQSAGERDSEEKLNGVKSPNGEVEAKRARDNSEVTAQKETENIKSTQSGTEIDEDCDFRIEETSPPCLNTNEIDISRSEVEEIEITDVIVRNMSKENKGELKARLESLQSGESRDSDHRGSPVFASGKMKRKLSPRKKVASKQPVLGELRTETAVSPTILRDRSNQVKILGGGTVEALARIEEFTLTSSDSDDETIYDQEESPGIINRGRKSSENRSSEMKVQRTNREKKVSREEKQQTAGPSTRNNDNDDGMEVISSDESNGGEPTRTKESNGDDRRKKSHKDNGRVDNRISISDSESDLPVEDQAAPSSGSGKLSPSKNAPTESRSKNAVPKKMKRYQPLTRNFLPWEQREMIKYLIDKNFIAEARGNNVWKQMVHDGFLTHRTYQSLNNHFRRSILPNIHRFSMSRENMKRFQRLIE